MNTHDCLKHNKEIWEQINNCEMNEPESQLIRLGESENSLCVCALCIVSVNILTTLYAAPVIDLCM